MEYIAIIIIGIITLILLKFSWNIKIKDIKKIKEIGYDKKLNEITNKLPENKEVCKAILKKLDNEKVKIQEQENNKTSLYLVLSDSILIADIKDTFTRIQTIAHECLHSIQNKRILIFNFIFSNIYFIYFIIICILGILKINIIPTIVSIFVLLMFGFVYYSVRSCLETDAMTKAKPLAKEYMEEEASLSKKEQNEILKNYEIINDIGIKLTNYMLISKCIFKVIMYSLILILFK